MTVGGGKSGVRESHAPRIAAYLPDFLIGGQRSEVRGRRVEIPSAAGSPAFSPALLSPAPLSIAPLPHLRQADRLPLIPTFGSIRKGGGLGIRLAMGRIGFFGSDHPIEGIGGLGGAGMQIKRPLIPGDLAQSGQVLTIREGRAGGDYPRRLPRPSGTGQAGRRLEESRPRCLPGAFLAAAGSKEQAGHPRSGSESREKTCLTSFALFAPSAVNFFFPNNLAADRRRARMQWTPSARFVSLDRLFVVAGDPPWGCAQGLELGAAHFLIPSPSLKILDERRSHGLRDGLFHADGQPQDETIPWPSALAKRDYAHRTRTGFSVSKPTWKGFPKMKRYRLAKHPLLLLTDALFPHDIKERKDLLKVLFRLQDSGEMTLGEIIEGHEPDSWCYDILIAALRRALELGLVSSREDEVDQAAIAAVSDREALIEDIRAALAAELWLS